VFTQSEVCVTCVCVGGGRNSGSIFVTIVLLKSTSFWHA